MKGRRRIQLPAGAVGQSEIRAAWVGGKMSRLCVGGGRPRWGPRDLLRGLSRPGLPHKAVVSRQGLSLAAVTGPDLDGPVRNGTLNEAV